MGGYTRFITKVFEHDDDKIKIKMRRLKRTEALQLMEFMKVTTTPTEEEGVVNHVVEVTNQEGLLDFVTDIFPRAIVEFSGLVVDGEVLEYRKAGCIDSEQSEIFREICESAYFMNLHTEIVSEMVAGSFVQGSVTETPKGAKTEVKKLESCALECSKEQPDTDTSELAG